MLQLDDDLSLYLQAVISGSFHLKGLTQVIGQLLTDLQQRGADLEREVGRAYQWSCCRPLPSSPCPHWCESLKLTRASALAANSVPVCI